MRNKNKKTGLLFWLVLAVVLTVASMLSVKIDNYMYRNSTPVNIGEKIIPGLNVDKVSSIKIKYPEGKETDLKREGASWVVANLYNYPADLEKINELLEKMFSARIIQNVTMENGAKKQLKLLRNNKDSNGTEVLLFDKNDKKLFDIIIGRKRTEELNPGKEIQLGRYVFIPAYNSIFFTDSLFNVVSYPKNGWLNKTFPKIKNIKSIESFDKKKLLWKIERNIEKGRFRLVENREKLEQDINGTERMISALNNMTFTSIASPKMNAVETGFNFPKEIKIITFDNKMYILRIGKKVDNDYYVKLYYYQSKNNVRKIIKRYKKWIYLIDSKRIDPLLISRSDLTKKLHKPKDDKFIMPIG